MIYELQLASAGKPIDAKPMLFDYSAKDARRKIMR